jgi:hypothetical protein
MLTKASLNGYKTIKVCHSKFIIRRINPVMDFELEHMPQIFTAFQSRRNTEKSPVSEKNLVEQMMRVVEAGLVEPELTPIGKGKEKGKEAGITIEDIFRDQELGFKLFTEIMLHSLNQFSGLKKVFFSMKIRVVFFINWLKLMASYQAKSHLTQPT